MFIWKCQCTERSHGQTLALLSHVESTICLSQNTTQVSITARNKRMAEFCQHHCDYWPTIDSQSFQRTSRSCQGPWTESWNTEPFVRYQCYPGTDIACVTIVLINEYIENVSKHGWSWAIGESDHWTYQGPQKLQERRNTPQTNDKANQLSIKIWFSMAGQNSLPSLTSVSKWVAIVDDVKKLALRGVIQYL